jgi:hypothetical protein
VEEALVRPDFSRAICETEDKVQSHAWPWLLVLAACGLASAGCQEEPRHVGDKPIVAKPEEPSGRVIGQQTQKIANAAPVLEQGHAKVASTKIVAKDPITLVGNAYVSIIGRAAQLKIEHALDLFHGANDRYPKDYAEFMAEIIKANNISLPALPPYQEYSYHEQEHKLIILEFPDRK